MTRRHVGRNRRALNHTVSALRALGRIEPVDEALVAAAGSAADAVDERATPGVLKEYREYLVLLSEVGGADSDRDAFAALLAEMGNTTPT